MDKLRISVQLSLLVGVLSALLLGIGALGLYGIGHSNEALKTVYEHRAVPIGQLADMNALQLNNRLALSHALLQATPAATAEAVVQIEANIATADRLWAVYRDARLGSQEGQLAQAALDARAQLLQDGMLPSLAALRAGNLKEAMRLQADKVRPQSLALEHALEALMTLQLDAARAQYAAAVAHLARVRLASLLAVGLGGLLAAAYGRAMARSIGRQLGAEPREAAALAQRVAAGELGTPIALRPGDTSSLMAQLKSMQVSLSDVVERVRHNADSLADAAAKIAHGNNELSGRTEQQASALKQTAVSMEELNATVSQNADHARQANQLALGASAVAVQGGEVVGRVVDTMRGIDDASRRIADITSVIDSIAFQTNILALNAAVEAARAGEQGRGFAVVAAEVRSLAQRSADAAKEIKGLITASVERVEQGTALVDQAGATMGEVVNAIKRVTDIMGEISAASSEQSAGVAQVGKAVRQMDQATQQNAALVEHSAAAAESLKQQAMMMVQAVAVFKAGVSATAPPAARSPAPEATYSGVERRGPGRARNVARPDFGARPAGPAPAPCNRPGATGTDDWDGS